MTYTTITYEVADRIATISLNRPEARNGYTIPMSDELNSAFDRADGDPEVRVVVLTGTGSNFCVGADLAGGLEGGENWGDGEDWNEPAGRCSMRIFEMNKPVITAIEGAAIGAGSTIVLPADYRLAATTSRFGFVFAQRGIYPEGASVWFLPKLVGLGAALDWMVSGRVFGADEALNKGLVHSLHEPGTVLDAAYNLARELITKSAPVSVAVIRQMLYRLSSLESPYAVQRIDSKLIAGMLEQDDTIEGMLSFLQKRAPEFTGKVPDDIPAFLPWRGDTL
ncbi:enoyl-CoA hydratase-related protein [Smaragdicoccus niigatensis]|uniref:enoyl-CoA hydratase-related protein n=1 Tax=Smaragdicoccus niigatensis TaxID=359359 RepID=UPI00036AB517|nr:enoyl-CoA hydratase-related protein [Smaragdicoccus niigatensis]